MFNRLKRRFGQRIRSRFKKSLTCSDIVDSEIFFFSIIRSRMRPCAFIALSYVVELFIITVPDGFDTDAETGAEAEAAAAMLEFEFESVQESNLTTFEKMFFYLLLVSFLDS